MGVHSPPAAGVEYRPWVLTNAIIMSWPGSESMATLPHSDCKPGEVERRLHPLRRRRSGRRRGRGCARPDRGRHRRAGGRQGGGRRRRRRVERRQLEARLRARPAACGEHDDRHRQQRRPPQPLRHRPHGTWTPHRREKIRARALVARRGSPNRHEVAASSSVIVPDSTSCFDESWLPSSPAPWSRSGSRTSHGRHAGPEHHVDPSLNVPIGTSTPSASFSQAS